MAEPTYIFQDGKVYTYVGGKVVSAVKEADFDQGGAPGVMDSQGQGPVEMPGPPSDIQNDLQDSVDCPSCGAPSSPEDQFCSQCGEPLAQGAGPEGGVPGADLYGQAPPEQAQMVANTVTTPNGLKGKILGRVRGTWGEEVTVRFDNGVIRRIPVSQELTFESSEDKKPTESEVEHLDRRLAATTSGDLDDLTARLKELKAIQQDARKRLAGGSDSDMEALDRITVQAAYELAEVEAALSHIGSEMESPAIAPIENLPHVQQASMGGSDATWLDKTIGEMQAEAAATDYKKLMDEGPEAFVAGLEDAQLADAGTVRVMASRWIRSRTAGADQSIRDKYDRVWLARIEEQRRKRLAGRKEEVRKEAAAQDDSYSGPDDALFL